MKTFIQALLISIFMIPCCYSQDPQIIKLTPPSLKKEALIQEIVCTRPMREGKFQISQEVLKFDQSEKNIFHCYGHGGSGWTTLFGSVNQAIQLFLDTHPDKNVPIRVIGSGCMGLTTAIELNRLGYHVKQISTKDLLNIPSWKAAGYFALVSVKTSPEEQEHLNKIGMETFLTYRQIDQGKHPYLTQEAVKFMPVYCSVDTDAGVEDLEAKGLIPPRKYVTLDFGNQVVHEGFIEYMTYFMNTTTLMKQLHQQVELAQIPIVQESITSFEDIAEDVIFNCTGIGSKQLCEDQAMVPVRGHLIVLGEESGQEHMEYMIYSKFPQNEDEYIYMFPKDVSVTLEHPEGLACRGVLGGTFIPNVDKLSKEEQKQLDEREFKKLLDRNALFFYGKPF